MQTTGRFQQLANHATKAMANDSIAPYNPINIEAGLDSTPYIALAFSGNSMNDNAEITETTAFVTNRVLSFKS